MTTRGQAPGGRDSELKDGETAKTGRGQREGGTQQARLVGAVRLRARRRESPRLHCPAPAPESAPRGSSLRTRRSGWSMPPPLRTPRSLLARDLQLPPRGSPRSPILKGCPFASPRSFKIVPPSTGIHHPCVSSLLLGPAHSRRKRSPAPSYLFAPKDFAL